MNVRSMRWGRAEIAGGFLLAAVVGAGPAGAQLLQERLSFLPAGVEFGPGTVRLEGMGGFETAVHDENLEITLLDFSDNPAGFSEDRDAWSVELRYRHNEYAERDQRQNGNDIFINVGTFRGGFHRPGKVGVGLQIDFAEASASAFDRVNQQFDLYGFRGMVNAFVIPTLSVGAGLGLSTETEDRGSRSIYNIDHDNTTVRGGVGAAWLPVRGVALGARGDLISTQIDGLSTGDFHTDQFSWSRPAGFYSVHGFVNRGRLNGGIDVSGLQSDGDEEVRVSWSEKFILNPTPRDLIFTSTTFTEDREQFRVKSRWAVDVTPEVTVSLATQNATEDFKIVSDPNVFGSRTAQDVSTETSAIIGGGSVSFLQRRLLLGAEMKIASVKVEDAVGPDAVTNERDETTIRAGGEYFLGERVVGRGGLIYTSEEFNLESNPDASGTFKTTRLAAGLGILPAGAIWQLDLALDLVLDSELDSKLVNASAYVKYLF